MAAHELPPVDGRTVHQRPLQSQPTPWQSGCPLSPTLGNSLSPHGPAAVQSELKPVSG